MYQAFQGHNNDHNDAIPKSSFNNAGLEIGYEIGYSMEKNYYGLTAHSERG